jgi:predicted Zn-dependent protease
MGTRILCGYHSIMKFRLLVAPLILALALPIHPEGLPDLGDSSESTLSLPQERVIGIGIMREVHSDPSYVDDPEISAYISSLGARLVANCQDPSRDFEFFVVQDSAINAFAMPGGKVGMNTGTILAAQNESELAGVLAHETSHVTQRHIARQLAGQKASMIASLAAMAAAILAARSNSQVAQAAMVSAQATSIQSPLNYTREHEEEADRIGLMTLTKSGFDPRGMVTFFERMQRATRAMESNAPSYLRTHPLTVERIAELQNRAEKLPARQVPDSLDFQLTKAKVRAMNGSPNEAVRFFAAEQMDAPLAPPARLYGTAVAALRNRDFVTAQQSVDTLHKSGLQHPMIEVLAAQIKAQQGDYAKALDIYQAALRLYPNNHALFLGRVQALLDLKRNQDALAAINDRMLKQDDDQLYEMQARTYAALGKKLLQHQAQAEVYYRRGNLLAAVDQLQTAKRSGDGDFYQLSSVEARLNQLRAEVALLKGKKGWDSSERP